jgi:hypothetical protein
MFNISGKYRFFLSYTQIFFRIFFINQNIFVDEKKLAIKKPLHYRKRHLHLHNCVRLK